MLFIFATCSFLLTQLRRDASLVVQYKNAFKSVPTNKPNAHFFTQILGIFTHKILKKRTSTTFS